MSERKILIVDDEADQVELYEEWLTGAGYIVESNISPKQAILQAECTEFDLIISDFSMPEMNGVNFVAQLSKVVPRHKLRVIMLTGISDDLTLSVIESMPQITLVKKPITKKLLLDAVAKQLASI